MQLSLEEINAVLANRAVISSWDVLVQNYTQALSLYRKAYTQSHDERFSAYQQAEQEIRSSAKEHEVEPEKVDKLLKNWKAYLCEKLDWDETLFRCRSCGAPLSTINFHLKLVETDKGSVKHVMLLVEIAKKVIANRRLQAPLQASLRRMKQNEAIRHFAFCNFIALLV